MNDTIQRVKYFTNQFLRVEEFEAEQGYHRQMRRLHNSRLHEWGIARGLTVLANSSEADGLIITDGAAIDQDGYEIVSFHPLNTKLEGYQDNADVYVTIAYDQLESATRVQKGLSANNRWTEEPVVATSEKEPEVPGKQMLLAKVTLKNGRVDNIDNSVRKLAGVISKELTARSIKFEVPGVKDDQWPQMESGSENQANPTGDLKLTADNLRVDASTQIEKNVQIGTDDAEASLDVRGTLTVKKFIVDGFEEKCFSSKWFWVGDIASKDTENSGCDSFVVVKVQVYPDALHHFDPMLCFEESIMIEGRTFDRFNRGDTIVLSGASQNGCDSTIFVNVQFHEGGFNYVNPFLCFEERMEIHGVVYDRFNRGDTILIPGAAHTGCDSTIFVDLQFFEPAYQYISPTICFEETFETNGIIFDRQFRGDTLWFPGSAATGCDSAVIVDVIFREAAVNFFNPLLCPDETVEVLGRQYDRVNRNDTLLLAGAASAGCDSSIIISLRFFNPVDTLIQEAFCDSGGSLTINGATFDLSNSSGTTIIPSIENGCDSLIYTVDLLFPQTSMEIITDAPICKEERGGSISVQSVDETIFTSLSVNGISYDNKPINRLSEGNYTIRAVDEYGCILDTMIRLTALSGLLPSGPVRTVTVPLGEIIALTPPDLEDLVNHEILTDYDSLLCSNCPQISVAPLENTIYNILLEDSYGCIGVEKVKAFVTEDVPFFAPNAFSPNDDGINDQFSIYPKKMLRRIMRFLIFDRWGEIVYDHNSVGDREKVEWDGYLNGQKAGLGVYVWYAEVELINGKKKKLSGDLALIR